MDLNDFLAKLDRPNIVRPTRRMTQAELESYLDKTADILRGNADHSCLGSFHSGSLGRILTVSPASRSTCSSVWFALPETIMEGAAGA
jgi:hypothetical protein